MNPELIYFLKVNVALVVFYGFYRLFFYKDTFFRWRRLALLSFLVIAFIHPFFDLQSWVKQHEPMVALADMYATIVMPESPVVQEYATPIAQETAKIPDAILPFLYAYLGVALILILRLLIQFAGLVKLRFITSTGCINDIKVRLLPNESGPFSFFKWIFIHPEMHTDDEINEILTHETAHARQWHSIDVLFSELICIICWFNPFIWLIKREIRNNLEFLADSKVIETGYDCRSYQYHLLGLAHQKQVSTIYNNFNVLPLKKRIRMMNKKRTKQVGRAKYFIFPLLAAALLLISNIEAVARTTEKVVEEIIVNHIETVTEVEQEDPVYEVVDHMPQFPGGQAELMKFISTNIKYPPNAATKKIQGRVIIQFIVNKDGSISDSKIIRSVDPELDREALRVISMMPNWTHGSTKVKW